MAEVMDGIMAGPARKIVSSPVKTAMSAGIVIASDAKQSQEELADNHGAAGNGTDKVNGIHGKPPL